MHTLIYNYFWKISQDLNDLNDLIRPFSQSTDPRSEYLDLEYEDFEQYEYVWYCEQNSLVKNGKNYKLLSESKTSSYSKKID